MGALFGAGGIGLRALATGLPASFLLSPRKALAGTSGCASATKAQYIIFNTSGGGDPIGTNAPGTYGDTKIVHPMDSSMASVNFMLGNQQVTAAKPWSTLPSWALARTQFWHIMTNTPVHPREPQVLQLMGAAVNNEMLPSLLAKAVAPCLGTIQQQPISIGAYGPSEAIFFNGSPLPVIPPLALKDTLSDPAGPLTQLQSIRDQTMNTLYKLYRDNGGVTPSQQAFLDQMTTSQQQVRNIKQSLLSTLGSIKDNSVASQITAAVTLIQMNVSPVIGVHIPFGGDNHGDPSLTKETTETVSGVQSIVSLLTQLQSAIGANGQSLQDQVTFMTLSVFGRTMATNGGASISAADGRAHNPNLQTSLVIGKPFTPGMIGAVAPVGIDYGCTGIDSSSGAGSASGDVAPIDTLGAFAQTMLAAVGGDPTQVTTGKVIGPALA